MHFARNKCYGMVSSVPVSLFIGRLIKTRVWVFSNCIKEITPEKGNLSVASVAHRMYYLILLLRTCVAFYRLSKIIKQARGRWIIPPAHPLHLRLRTFLVTH